MLPKSKCWYMMIVLTCFSPHWSALFVQSRIGYNAVGHGPRISAAREKMGPTANNNAVINCHLYLWSPHVCLEQVYLETI